MNRIDLWRLQALLHPASRQPGMAVLASPLGGWFALRRVAQ